MPDLPDRSWDTAASSRDIEPTTACFEEQCSFFDVCSDHERQEDPRDECRRHVDRHSSERALRSWSKMVSRRFAKQRTQRELSAKMSWMKMCLQRLHQDMKETTANITKGDEPLEDAVG